MFARFTQAIVRAPTANFAEGLTSVDLGVPRFEDALRQHAAYCAALARAGCTVTALAPDARYPDATFVEDTALVLPGIGAILTRPGAESRRGEVDLVRPALSAAFAHVAEVVLPGTLDAGDVCETESQVLIGLSHRTNAEGAMQLARWLTECGVRSTTLDIRGVEGILHLKSGVTALGEGQLLAIEALAAHPALRGYHVALVPSEESYAANAVLVNERVFVAQGFPRTQALIGALGYAMEILDVSEFAKMDGGLSCLSLRF